MKFVRIEDRRINPECIVRYQPILVQFDANCNKLDFASEVELTSGKAFYTKLTVEQLDELLKDN